VVLVKASLRIVIVFGLLGTVIAGVLGYMAATFGSCAVLSEDPGATCYRVFGHYLSETTYFALIEPLKGLVIGLGSGLLIVMGRWMWHRLRLPTA
jgi:hypothetical protein